jgi:hypothetical protein
MPMSFADVLRITAKDLLSPQPVVGYPEMTARERRVTGVLLNIVANTNYAPYPPTDADRESAAKRLGALAWDTRALFQQFGKSVDDSFATALDQALAIIKEV